MLNYNFVQQKAKDSKIDDVTIEREYWQLLFLQRIYLANQSERIFFKGGTAIRFLYGSFRFSEDLDFTSTLKSQKLESLLKETFHFFEKYASVELQLKKEKTPQVFQDVLLRYRFLFQPYQRKQKTSIRIDVSLREKPLSVQQSILIPFDYPISPYPLVVHLSLEELFAEKIRALFVRSKPRDLFDIWFLLTKKAKIKQPWLEKKFKLYPKLKFSQNRLRDKILSFKKNDLKKDLNQFLPENYRNFYLHLQEETLKLFS